MFIERTTKSQPFRQCLSWNCNLELRQEKAVSTSSSTDYFIKMCFEYLASSCHARFVSFVPTTDFKPVINISGSIEGLSVDTVAEDGKRKFFQRIFRY